MTCAFFACLCRSAVAEEKVIRVGFNLPITGMFELVGSHSKNAAELIRKEIDAAGGLLVGDSKYRVEFLYGDNESNPGTASKLAIDQVSHGKVLGIIGPQSSRQAIPVSQMANSFSTPMITPWSTSPVTTQDKPFVFRSCFIFTMQGPIITKFAAKEWGVKKAAVLYDIVSDYPRGMAKAFREAFEKTNGSGSVVAFEEFRTGDQDFSKQMEKIKESGAELLFTPQHYDEVPVIVREAQRAGLTIPIMGSNSWAGGDLIGTCKGDCEGLYFTGNYAPGGAKGINKTFVDKYLSTYNELPDEPAALTWDAVRVFLEAVKNAGKLTGNLINDRKAVRDAIVGVKNFDGATGVMTFNESGTPDKCAVIVKIENDTLNFHESVCQ